MPRSRLGLPGGCSSIFRPCAGLSAMRGTRWAGRHAGGADRGVGPRQGATRAKGFGDEALVGFPTRRRLVEPFSNASVAKAKRAVYPAWLRLPAAARPSQRGPSRRQGDILGGRSGDPLRAAGRPHGCHVRAAASRLISNRKPHRTWLRADWRSLPGYEAARVFKMPFVNGCCSRSSTSGSGQRSLSSSKFN